MLYRTIDLCAGIGGIRRGFELTNRFVNVFSAEIDKYACMTYKTLFNENPYNDITLEETKSKIDNIEYEVLLAGFPCQTFSRAGLKEGFNNAEKGYIFFHISEIIKRTRPRAFLLENVDHLITHNKKRTFKTILEILCNDLKYKVIGVSEDSEGSLQYDSKDFIRNSKNFGVPQNRPRTYIMGFDRLFYGECVELLNEKLPSGRKEIIYKNLNDILENKVPAKYYIASGYLNTLKKHKKRNSTNGNGFGYRIVNAPLIKNPIANTLLATGGSGKERNLIYDPNKEIEGLIVKGKKTPLNDSGLRFMTPIEWGKLQGFINYAFVDKIGTDKFVFPNGLSDAQKYKQFGNTVTIPTIEQMALFMLSCFKILEKHKNL